MNQPRHDDVALLTGWILIDSDGGRSRIIGVRGSEAGLDHLEITTQSPWEEENGIKTVHRIFTSEAEA